MTSKADRKFQTTQRMLPHWELEGATYFITFNTWEKLELTPAARQIIFDACLFFNTQRYHIFNFVVMTDHVHLLMQPLQKCVGASLCDRTYREYWSLSSIAHSIKSYSAKQIPQVMPHIGTIWQPERYDRIVRGDREFAGFWNYIRQNPVKAKLSKSPEEYPFFWQTPTLVG
ncbi:MAG: transposase [Cyanosarcina radialis HA8281-LM2]|jgi:REP element-mobilizing transposase RayT|nr:transposase [Cyanosarcina radialis HA8281-LM2]